MTSAHKLLGPKDVENDFIGEYSTAAVHRRPPRPAAGWTWRRKGAFLSAARMPPESPRATRKSCLEPKWVELCLKLATGYHFALATTTIMTPRLSLMIAAVAAWLATWLKAPSTLTMTNLRSPGFYLSGCFGSPFWLQSPTDQKLC